MWDVSGIFLLFSVVSSCPTDLCKKGVLTIIFTDHYSSIFTFQSFLQFGLCDLWTLISCIWVSLTFQRTFLSLFFMMTFLIVKMFSSRVIFFMSWKYPLPSILTIMFHIPSLLLFNMYLPLTFIWASASHWLGYVWTGYDWVLIVTQYATCLTEKWQAVFSRYS